MVSTILATSLIFATTCSITCIDTYAEFDYSSYEAELAKMKTTQVTMGDFEVKCYLNDADKTVIMSSLVKGSGSLDIPAEVTVGNTRYKVTTVLESFAYNNSKINRVIGGENIFHIGPRAFYNCRNLKELSLNTNNTSAVIDDEAFRGTGLTEVTLRGFAVFGHSSFMDNRNLVTFDVRNLKNNIVFGNEVLRSCTALTSVNLADEVTSIGSKTFFGCKELRKISIGSGLTGNLTPLDFGNIRTSDIDSKTESVSDIRNEYYISGCPKLQAINVSKDNKVFSSIQGILYNKNATRVIYIPTETTLQNWAVPATVTEISEYAGYCNNSIQNVSFRGKGNIVIDKYAFAAAARLNKVVIKSDVSLNLESYSFAKSSLKTISGTYIDKIKTAFYGTTLSK